MKPKVAVIFTLVLGWMQGTALPLAALSISVVLSSVPAHAQPFAYVANRNPDTVSGTVSVIDTATNAVVATVPVGAYPRGVAVTPDGTRVYVANGVSNNVSVIDAATNAVVATVVGVPAPARVAITPDGKRAYVTANVYGGDVHVINTDPSSPSFHTVVATIDTGFLQDTALAITPDGTRAYVGNQGTPVSVIDTDPSSPSFHTIVATVPVYSYITGGVAITPDGTRVYVTNGGTNTISVISVATNTVVATISGRPPLGFPDGLAITPDGSHAYVANTTEANVVVINTATNTVVAAKEFDGHRPKQVAITPDGRWAYVTIDSADAVRVIDTATNTVLATIIGVGDFPDGIAITQNRPPAITLTPVTRQQGTSGSALIATVSDAEDTAGSLGAAVQSANPSNGVTLSGIANSAGNVTADVAAACTASNASFTLRVTDSGGAFADGTLDVTVTPSIPAASAAVGISSLLRASSDLINVGLAASATGNCSPVLQVLVYANENDETPTSPGIVHSPDAKDLGNGTLRLRAERLESGSGRVYLIVVRATNSGGNTHVAVATVVVPKGQRPAAIAALNAAAAAAQTFALANNGSAPAGYFVVGDGPVIGPKQ